MGRFDFAEQKGFALWPDGYYPAVIVEQYEVGENRTIFRTEDSVSQKGDSRNIQICYAAVKVDDTGGFTTTETRYLSQSINYRSDDLDPERVKEVQAYKTSQGKVAVKYWPDKDMQRTFLAYAKIGELDKLLGKDLPTNGSGFDLTGLIKMEADVRVVTKENQQGKKFNRVDNVSPRGSRVKDK